MKFLKLLVSSSLLLLGGVLVPVASAQESLPLVQRTDLEYLGAFRLPRGGDSATSSFSFGGNTLAFDPADGGLFVSTRESYVAKIKIPALSKSPSIESLPFSTFIEKFHDPLEGGLSFLPQSSIRGLLVSDGKLFGTAMIYYDANNSARVSHFSRSTDLSQPSVTPLKPLWQAEKSGYVAGWLASVPKEWQSFLGGSVISGNCCVPIISRTSFGPSAFAWTPHDFDKSLVPASPLLYYPAEHPTIGRWEESNPVYGGTTTIGGMVIPAATRSLLYFGSNGTGKFCYGTGGASGGECTDPLSSSKGQHAYPYNYQIWAYDLNDLASVKAGRKNPWEIKPYGVWKLEFPNSFMSLNGIGGVAYDEAKQIIYVSQAEADVDGYSSRALIHAFRVKTAKTPVAQPEAAIATSTMAIPDAKLIKALEIFLKEVKNRLESSII